MYGTLICAVLVLAITAGSYWQGHKNGHNEVQVDWDAANIAAADLANATRKANQAKAASLSKRYEAKIATQQQTNKQIADALERELTKEPFAADCVLPDGVRVNVWNAANAGKSIAAGELPKASGAAAGATVKQP